MKSISDILRICDGPKAWRELLPGAPVRGAVQDDQGDAGDDDYCDDDVDDDGDNDDGDNDDVEYVDDVDYDDDDDDDDDAGRQV